MAPGGTIVRLDRERTTYTVVTGGFRNPYDLAFNLAGETFTFDADMEWDINLPWYREVRSVHAVQGADYGWRHGSGKLPDYYLDTLPPVREVGRGSPVGVEFYQSHAYPATFHDNFFEADWSRGRILYTPVTPSGATYRCAATPRSSSAASRSTSPISRSGPTGCSTSAPAGGRRRAGCTGCGTRVRTMTTPNLQHPRLRTLEYARASARPRRSWSRPSTRDQRRRATPKER
jgi:hypothetical protein